MFSTIPSYNPFRPQKLTDPEIAGEDVYALQTALFALCRSPGTSDGVFGENTSLALIEVQALLGIDADGIAGPQTWAAIATRLGVLTRQKYGLALGLLYGQMAGESGFFGGMYSRPARPDGTFDAGIAQRNTQFTAPIKGFNVPMSVDALGGSARLHYDLFAGVADKKRRWGLAAGAWNAPAFAKFIANEEGAQVPTRDTKAPGTTARQKLETYIATSSAFLR